MSRRAFQIIVGALGLLFALFFAVVVLPPLGADPDVLGAFAAGFVNPYAAGYATDAIMCWCVLATWVVYEAKTQGIRHGWIAVVLGLVPGVATGFAFYLLLRLRHARGDSGA